MRTIKHRFAGIGASVGEPGYCGATCRALDKMEYDPEVDRAKGETVAAMNTNQLIDFALNDWFIHKRPTERELVYYYASLGIRTGEMIKARVDSLFSTEKRAEIAEKLKYAGMCIKHERVIPPCYRACIDCVPDYIDRKITSVHYATPRKSVGSAGILAYNLTAASATTTAAATPPARLVPLSGPVDAVEPILIRHSPDECSDPKCNQCFTLTNEKTEYTFAPSRVITKEHKGLIWRIETKEKTGAGLTIDVGESYTEFIKVIGQDEKTKKDRVKVIFTTPLALGVLRWIL